MQVNEVDNQGFTALHIAADRNLAAIAGLLLAQGATVDPLDIWFVEFEPSDEFHRF